jgi:hypothetical protein
MSACEDTGCGRLPIRHVTTGGIDSGSDHRVGHTVRSQRPYLFSLLLLAGLTAATAWSADAPDSRLQGRFDNAEQVAKAPAGQEPAIPHVTITIEPTPKPDFALWRVHLETDPESSFDQTWAMQTRIEHDGSGALIPYYQLKQEAPPAAATFDTQGWLSLEACALRGDFSKTRIEGISEGEPCVAVSMNVGARRALLPVGFVREGEMLHVDLNLRGVRTRIDAKQVQ